MCRAIRILLAALALAAAAPQARAAEARLANPTKRAYTDELVRLPAPAPGPAGTFVVRSDGEETPHQVERIDGADRVWILADFAPESARTFQVAPGRPKAAKARVTLTKDADAYILDNGLVAVRVPAVVAGAAPGPIAGVRMNGRWTAASAWRTARTLKVFAATVLADGPLLAKVRLRYDFAGPAGPDGRSPAFAEIDVTIGPGWRHAEIAERHEMGRDDLWVLDLARGWTPTRGVSQPFSGGAGSGLVGGKVEPERPLKPGGLPYQRPDMFIALLPRWNQHYKDGWFFAATDGQAALGAVVVRAGRWTWPHENALRAVVRDSGDAAALECPAWKGRRLWWLVGPDRAPLSIDYVARYAWEGLDKINHEMIAEWPGRKGGFAGMNLYDGNQVNPTSGIRGAGRRAIAEADKPGDLAALTRQQVMFHPDAYGTYADYWSPENPNFFTDFMRVPVALTARLREHPRFDDLRRQAEAVFREDLDHSVTLPGGAGQECPGYVGHALKQWTDIADLCRTHLGFDPREWPRYRAAQGFLRRTSQPDGPVRRALPMGDSHPAKEGGMAVVDVPADEVRRWRTEELPGFGAVFAARPGTPDETFLAFKSGPNRGHYHGDQLAFHYAAQARPLAVDHHCSYKPRAGQEHMHNRVSFGTSAMPWANMDGYERLIAFRTSDSADVAVGQVESDRLRSVEKLPPEIWHQEYPQHRFAAPLVYRRTVVLVKGGPRDYVVLRDQFRAPEPVAATFCLHVLADAVGRQGPRVDFGGALTLFAAEPAAFDFEPFPWSHDNGGREATQGARLTVRAQAGQFITVLWPGKDAPPMAAVPGGVTVGDDAVRFAGGLDAAGPDEPIVTVTRGGRTLLALMGKDIDMDRSQGDVGLFVPDAGYPFGAIPDWLLRQRVRPGGPRP
jgi:hypothetical protein